MKRHLEIIKQNKLIAEFMGAKFQYYTDFPSKATKDIKYVWGSEADIFRNCKNWWRCSFKPKDNFSWNFPDDLDYHENWDSLIKVIKKIESLGFTVCIEGRRCKVLTKDNWSVCDADFTSTTKIKATYKSVYNFIVAHYATIGRKK